MTGLKYLRLSKQEAPSFTRGACMKMGSIVPQSARSTSGKNRNASGVRRNLCVPFVKFSRNPRKPRAATGAHLLSLHAQHVGLFLPCVSSSRDKIKLYQHRRSEMKGIFLLIQLQGDQ